MTEWSFKNLDLSKTDLPSGGAMPVGDHIMKIVDAKMSKTKRGGDQLEVYYENSDGKIRDYIQLRNPADTENARTSERIGRERLKSIYHYGGHADPDNAPSQGVAGLIGLEIGCRVVEQEFTGKDGQLRKGTGLKNGGAYFSPSEINGSAPTPSSDAPNDATPSDSSTDLDDEIPF